MIGVDLDGTYTAGFQPEQGFVIITGRTFDEYDDIVKAAAAKVPVYLRGTGDKSDLESIAKFKAVMIHLLGIDTFYEDEPSEVAVIREICPGCNVILVNN